MLILLVEDDLKISKMLIHLLNKDGFQIDHAIDGLEALSFAEINVYDLVILDWMMPELSGIDVCKKLRSANYSGGILMLTAKDALEDKILGLETGADDYLVKPFEYKELHARIKALGRRSTKTIKENIYTVGNFTIDRNSKLVYINNTAISLSNREYQLFDLLIENKGQIVSREIILDRIWGITGDVTDNNLDSFIKLLRKKIDVDKTKKILINVRGIGYKLEV